MPDGDVLSDHSASAKVIASALYHWWHDCNRMGHGVIACGGCHVELNGFANRDGDGLAEDLRLSLSQRGWLLTRVSDIAEVAEERDRLLGKWSETDALWIEAKAEVQRLREAIGEMQDDLRNIDPANGWGPVAHALQVAEMALPSDEETR